MDKSRRPSRSSSVRSSISSKRSVASSVVKQVHSSFQPPPRKSRKTKKNVKHKADGHFLHGVHDKSRTTQKHQAVKKSNASTTGVFGPACILRIPRKIRIKIWKLLDFKEILHLRLACRSIRKDVDNFVGVKVELDDIDESFPHLIKLGLQCVIILDILTIQGQFLVHPELLTDLQILGGVTPFTFTRMLLDCQNLAHLTIQFNKDLCIARPRLFPVDLPRNSNRKILQKLKSLRIEAPVKTDQDLRYVRNIFVGLVEKHLMKQIHLQRIHVVITHKALADIISECNRIMASFVCDNCQFLKALHSEIRVVQVVNLVDEFLKGKDLGGDIAFSDLLQAEVCPEPKNPPWEDFKKLEELHFSCGPKDFSCYWEKMATKISKLRTLSMEIPSPVSWTRYKAFVTPNCATLRTVRFLECDNFGSKCEPLPIDLRVFRKCKKLETLVIVQSKSSGVGSRLAHISSLPSGVKEVDFYWLILTWYQAIRLARYPHLQSLKLSYFSPSNPSFGRFLLLLRWLYTCGCTRTNEFIILDHKIRYQQNKKRLSYFLKERKSVQAEYVDYDETWLELRRKGGGTNK